jgi:hypothetical protein
MTRRMLLGLKERAEMLSGARPSEIDGEPDFGPATRLPLGAFDGGAFGFAPARG